MEKSEPRARTSTTRSVFRFGGVRACNLIFFAAAKDRPISSKTLPMISLMFLFLFAFFLFILALGFVGLFFGRLIFLER